MTLLIQYAGIAIIVIIAILTITFLIKGIEYLNNKEAKEAWKNYYEAQQTLDEIEQELNNRQD